ncbi:MAG: arabinogalactan endo-1,4-beta-galactosidase [Bacteroidetes bacterium B1(2017)]|nr:MAG: arabinogalactan endo-1,4-beta-galactosidase [Bacteroidetes bacterium B1(2017)]
MRYTLVIFVGLFCFFACKKDKTKDSVSADPNFSIKAVDLSSYPEIKDLSFTTFNAAGYAEDMLLTLKNSGVNTIRLRIWKDPINGRCGLEEVSNLSKVLKQNGFKVWLTVHYSDTWADPGAQTKPEAWKLLSFAQLKDSVYAYTKQIVTLIHPDYIQIGNEVNNGFLWPEGSLLNKAQFLELLSQGIKAVRQESPESKLILQYAGYRNAQWFLTNIGTVDVDMIGLSYYPMWHGNNLDSLQSVLTSIATQTGKEVLIAETSYPFTLGWNDWTNNVLGDSTQLHPSYPATPQGQKDFLDKIRLISISAKNGKGFCYWGAELISTKGSTSKVGSAYENQALWDFNAKALPAMSVYLK